MKGNTPPSPSLATTSATNRALPMASAAPQSLHDAAATAIAAAVVGGQLYRRPTVRELTGLSDSTLDRMIRAGTFPQPIKLGPRSVAWRSADLAAWMASLPGAQ
ncbi:helix-turn-helix transcriptional regulator [Cupriavidus basilensis]